MMHPPVSLSRLHFTPSSHEVVYVPKAGHDESEPTEAERIDAMESVDSSFVDSSFFATMLRRPQAVAAKSAG
jgi:hypothetical protein